MGEHRPEAEAAHIDREIGARLRHVRKARGLSQSALGEAVGVTFQQLQKYERGTNRVASSSLVLMARRLAVPVTELLGDNDHASAPVDWTLFETPGAQELLESLRRISSPRLRRVVLNLAAELADVR